MNTVEQVRLIVALKPIPPGQLTLYKILDEAGDRWVSRTELADTMRWGDNLSLRGVLGALGKRARHAEGMSRVCGIQMLIEKKQVDGELHYRMSPELRVVTNSLPTLREAMKLSVDEIHAKYEHEPDWLSISLDTDQPDLSETRRPDPKPHVLAKWLAEPTVSPTLGMCVISWNLNGRVARLGDQIDALVKYRPDVVALQEVLTSTTLRLKQGLSEAGLVHAIDSFSLTTDSTVLTRRRRYGELLASRWPLIPLSPASFPVPWMERILSAVLETPWGAIEIHTTGIPPGVSNGWLKVEMFEGIYKRLACRSEIPRVVCGDLNTPQAESPDGQVTTWGQDILKDGGTAKWKTWRDPHGQMDSGERWDRAERNILAGLADFDLSDVFRALNGHIVNEFSWYWKGNGRNIGRRFDHVFASHSLNPSECRYLHSLRECGLSDHSPIEAKFEPHK